MAWDSSITSDILSEGSDAVAVDSDDFNHVTSVDVSLSDRVDDVLGGVLNLLLALRQYLDLEVVTHELVVKDGSTELRTGALHTIGDLVIRANGIIPVDDTFAVLDTAEQVEGVVWHEAAAVERGRELLGDAGRGGRALVLHLVLADHEQQVLVEGLDVGHHACRGQDSCLGQLDCL